MIGGWICGSAVIDHRYGGSPLGVNRLEVDLSVPPAFPSRGSAAVGPPDLNLLRPLMIPTEGLAVVASRPRRGPLGLLSRPRPGPLGFNRLVADLSPIASLTSPWL